MNSRVGFTTGAITLAMVLGLLGVWTINDPVRADSKDHGEPAKTITEDDRKEAQQRLDKLEKERAYQRRAYTDLKPGDSIRMSFKEREIISELANPATLDYSGVPLKNALEHLAKLYGIDVMFHAANIEDADLSLHHNIDASLLEATTLASALDLLLEPAGLAYFIRRDALIITTPEILENIVLTRAYAIPATESIAAREELASHLTSLLFAKQSSYWTARANERREVSETQDDPGPRIRVAPTIEVFTDRVIMVGSTPDHKALQELLRLIYRDYTLTGL